MTGSANVRYGCSGRSLDTLKPVAGATADASEGSPHSLPELGKLFASPDSATPLELSANNESNSSSVSSPRGVTRLPRSGAGTAPLTPLTP
eukprot:scaffold61328_cov26-Tisochrysis_lutea.AAC.2